MFFDVIPFIKSEGSSFANIGVINDAVRSPFSCLEESVCFYNIVMDKT